MLIGLFSALTFRKENIFYFSRSRTTPEPPKYKANSAVAIKICVTGSVDGVITAANVVATTTTYFQADNILLPETTPKSPRITCTTGTRKANPVVKINTAIKSKY